MVAMVSASSGAGLNRDSVSSVSPGGQRLAGRVVLLTGIASGQGREAALLFAAHGALVVGSDLNLDEAEATAAMAAKRGLHLDVFAPVDLGDEDAVAGWVADAVAVHGRIDVLYNNAGAARFSPVFGHNSDDWRFTMRNELDLVFFAIKHTWPHLALHGGSIINVASTAALAGSTTLPRAALAAAKGGVLALTRQVAAEGAPHKIRCNVVSPGPVATPQSEAAIFSNPGHPMAGIARHIPLGRLASPADVAFAALFLASDESSYITGINLVVDGGLSSVLPGAPASQPIP